MENRKEAIEAGIALVANDAVIDLTSDDGIDFLPRAEDDKEDNDGVEILEDKSLAVNSLKRQRAAEERSMLSTSHGRAWIVVRGILQLHDEINRTSGGKGGRILTVAEDDMVDLAAKFIECQTRFRESGIPARVTIGYHYTRACNMASIRQNGLMSKADRAMLNIQAGFQHGSFYGDGIYAATNPYAFHEKYGDVGLIVAMLLGNARRVSGATRRCQGSESNVEEGEEEVHTAIGNKRLSDPNHLQRHACISLTDYDEIVLFSSEQCLPLIRFCSGLITARTDGRGRLGNDLVWKYHQKLQKAIDKYFNCGNEAQYEQHVVTARTAADRGAAERRAKVRKMAAAVGLPPPLPPP